MTTLSNEKSTHLIVEKELETNLKQPSFDSHSVYSTTSTLIPAIDSTGFVPTTSLDISASGLPVLRFPLPSNELEIPVFSPSGHHLYTSVRAKRSSGSCVLRHKKLGDLVSTTYFFGPSREPVLRYLQGCHVDSEISVKGKWTSRSTRFTNVDGRTFEWSYANTKNEVGRKVNVIVLREQGRKDSKDSRIIARLVRSDETRTPGTTTCSAGNGGRLDIDDNANDGALDECIILATCIMMLKKEIDRRRGTQMAVIGGAASGGP